MRHKDMEDYKELAEKRGWEFIGGDVPENVKTPALWRCNNGHAVEISYDNLRRPERGCKYCSGLWRKSEDDYRLMGHIHGLIPVEMAENSRETSVWQDPEGNKIEASFRQLLQRRSTHVGKPLNVRKMYLMERIRDLSSKHCKHELDKEEDR